MYINVYNLSVYRQLYSVIDAVAISISFSSLENVWTTTVIEECPGDLFV
jgi:hypothetical protein